MHKITFTSGASESAQAALLSVAGKKSVGGSEMKNDRRSISERHQSILNMVRINGEVTVEDIAREFAISEMTVRRDLQVLSEKNLLGRVHGGAVSLANIHRVSDANAEVLACRDCISAYASRYVDDGDTIFINGSLTALKILENIRGKQVDVITNNAMVIGKNYDKGIRVKLTGGEVRGYVLVGDYVMKNLLEMQANKTFIGCAAVYDDGEFRYDIPTEIGINEAMISRTSEELYILADHSKLQWRTNQNQTYGSCIYEFPCTLITDELADEEIVESLKSQGIKVIMVPL